MEIFKNTWFVLSIDKDTYRKKLKIPFSNIRFNKQWKFQFP